MQSLTQKLTAIIDTYRKQNPHLLIAIDGRCASGKTTLAQNLKNCLNCNVIPMDHFFLRQEQRTSVRLNTPGENIDHERFLEEVLLPLHEGRTFSYRPYCCQTGSLIHVVSVPWNAVNIIEGSYSCHPELQKYYDLRIFLTVDPDKQIQRIIHRDGQQKAAIYQSKWIPLEEQYFSACSISTQCDYYFTT